MVVPSIRCRALIGRDLELQLLRDTRRSLSEGRGGAVLIAGDAGIGKSRLLAEFVGSLSGGRAPVYAFGECLEHAQSAFGPVRQILETLVRMVPSVAASAPPLALRMLRTLVPDALVATGQEANIDTLERAELFSGIVAYLEAVSAKRAVVIAIEDLHWADAASLELLVHVTGRIASSRLMIVATYRDRGMSTRHPLFAALARLTRLPNVTTAVLEPLANGEIASLVLDALDSRFDFASVRMAAVVKRSEGNPLFAEELLKLSLLGRPLEQALPISIRAIILERLVHLNPKVRRILDHAAILGSSFSTNTLSALLQESLESLLPDLAALAVADLIQEDRTPGGFKFRHALTREAIYDELEVTDARLLHARVARILMALPDADRRVDELAYQTWEAKLGDEAFTYNELAGEKALALHAPLQATALFSRALSIADERDDDAAQIRLLGRAGAAASQGCDFLTSIAMFTRLHDMQIGRGEYDAAGLALLRAANDIAHTNHAVEASALMVAFLAQHDGRLTSETTDRLNIALAYLATTQEEHDKVEPILRNVREPARLATHPYETYWLTTLFTAERQSDLTAWRAAVSALRGRIDEAHPLARAQVLHSIGQTALSFAQNDEAERSLDEALNFDREHGLTQAMAFASAITVRFFYLRGRLKEAIPLIRSTLAVRDMVAVRYQLMMGGPLVALAVGDESLARRCIDDNAFADTSDGTQAILNALVSTTMAAWLESVGRSLEARRILGKALDMLDRPFTDPHFWPLCATMIDENRLPRLRELCGFGAKNPQDRVMQATFASVEAIVARRSGDTRAACDFARTAADRYQELGWPLLRATALERAGERDGALAIYVACESFADIRRLELTTPATVLPLHSNRLSPREREVADLVARGLTNRAIARELRISESTVEKHISKIYAKLNFGTRTELAAYATSVRIGTTSAHG